MPVLPPCLGPHWSPYLRDKAEQAHIISTVLYHRVKVKVKNGVILYGDHSGFVALSVSNY